MPNFMVGNVKHADWADMTSSLCVHFINIFVRLHLIRARLMVINPVCLVVRSRVGGEGNRGEFSPSHPCASSNISLG
jgi:hypothetical protein